MNRFEQIKKILEFESDWCLNPTNCGRDECGFETHSPGCLVCQAQQIVALLALLEKPQTDSLRQPSPFREVPTIYTGGSAPPFIETEKSQLASLLLTDTEIRQVDSGGNEFQFARNIAKAQLAKAAEHFEPIITQQTTIILDLEVIIRELRAIKIVGTMSLAEIEKMRLQSNADERAKTLKEVGKNLDKLPPDTNFDGSVGVMRLITQQEIDRLKGG